MTEAVRTVIAFGFCTMQLNRVQAICEVENVASARVMEKVGMTFEGRLREYMFFKEHHRNLKMYSILRGEWDALVSQ
jgi:ribosomal-protein-alanine N-acetyltransferase